MKTANNKFNFKKRSTLLITLFIGIIITNTTPLNGQTISYPIVDTDVKEFYDNSSVISDPGAGNPFYGQDANYIGNQPSYTENNDGTITDNVTGLIWQKDMGSKVTYANAFEIADTMTLGGFTDWRVPTIKELYSLILFTGSVSGETAIDMFIDTEYFNQPLGDVSIGEREIDAQTWSSTQYIGLTMMKDTTVFGVNFIDGRIKGYPKYQPGNTSIAMTMYFRMVRENESYGENNYSDNNNGTISDNATGLMWQQSDSEEGLDWETALNYAENLELGGHSDWRLPNAKELHSIVDYTRCPDVTSSAAIDPLFESTSIDFADETPGQYPYYWTGSPHLDGPNPYSSAVYIAFGEAQGQMNNNIMDVHGAGAQRSDPKTGNPDDYPQFFGPQGDVRYVFNYVRCVRDLETTSSNNTYEQLDKSINVFPNPTLQDCTISYSEGIYAVQVIDLLGNIVDVIDNEGMQTTINIDMSSLNKGVYFLKGTCDMGTFTKKIIKK